MITMPLPTIVHNSGICPQIKYPKIPAQIIPEYLKGATKAASPYRNVSISRKCALPIKSPLKLNKSQSRTGTDVHVKGSDAKPVAVTPIDV